MDVCRDILPSSSFRLPSLLFPRTWKVAGLSCLEGCGSLSKWFPLMWAMVLAGKYTTVSL